MGRAVVDGVDVTESFGERMTHMKRYLWMVVAALALAPLAGAQEPAAGPPAPPARSVEPRAEQELKKMGEFLAGLPHFALEAEETFDEIPDGQLRRQLTNVRRVAVERPNRLAADATGDTLNRAAWYDGRTVTVLDKDHNVYATIEAPGTIDATFDKLADEYGLELPLADFLFADPYAVLMEGVTYGRYLGVHQAAGVACHHLAFSQADDRVADLDRRGRQAAAAQAGDQLRAGAGRAAVQRGHPALEPGVRGARGALHVRGPGGRAEGRREGHEAARG